MRIFGYEFKCLNDENIRDLVSLEREDAIYSEMWIDSLQDFRRVKMAFTTVEIKEYVRRLWAYELFLCAGSPELASQVSNIPPDIALGADNYVLHTSNGDTVSPHHCPAAFLGAELEALLCAPSSERLVVIKDDEVVPPQFAKPSFTRSNYEEYLKSNIWREKADEAKKRAGYRCQVCNVSQAQVRLDAHHRTYERLGNELPEDITILCRNCHKLFHQAKKLL